jgi:hypothetical protein
MLITPTSSRLMILPGELVALIGTGAFNPALSEVVLREAPRGRPGWPPASTTRSGRPASRSASPRSVR